jgi:hypothetical protein
MSDWSNITQLIGQLGQTKKGMLTPKLDAYRNRGQIWSEGLGRISDTLGNMANKADAAREEKKQREFLTGERIAGEKHDIDLIGKRTDEELRGEFAMWGADPGDFETYIANRKDYDGYISTLAKQNQADYLRLQATLNAEHAKAEEEFDINTAFDAALSFSLLPFKDKGQWTSDYGWKDGVVDKKTALQLVANFDSNISGFTESQKLLLKQRLSTYLDSLSPGWNGNTEEPEQLGTTRDSEFGEWIEKIRNTLGQSTGRENTGTIQYSESAIDKNITDLNVNKYRQKIVPEEENAYKTLMVLSTDPRMADRGKEIMDALAKLREVGRSPNLQTYESLVADLLKLLEPVKFSPAASEMREF